jgi:hypothetical protein
MDFTVNLIDYSGAPAVWVIVPAEGEVWGQICLITDGRVEGAIDACKTRLSTRIRHHSLKD